MFQPQSMMFPGLHPMAMMSTSNMGYTSRGSAGFPGGMYGSGPAPYPSMYQSAIPTAQPGGSQSGDTQVCNTQMKNSLHVSLLRFIEITIFTRSLLALFWIKKVLK